MEGEAKVQSKKAERKRDGVVRARCNEDICNRKLGTLTPRLTHLLCRRCGFVLVCQNQQSTDGEMEKIQASDFKLEATSLRSKLRLNYGSESKAFYLAFLCATQI